MMPSILLVEDNADNRLIYRTVLEHVGYSVLEAADGERALHLAREERPDLILMDVSIPKIDGYTATRELKADPATAHIPIIALTAHALAEDEQRARDAGCDGYIAKPAEPKAVLRHVQEHLARVGAD